MAFYPSKLCALVKTYRVLNKEKAPWYHLTIHWLGWQMNRQLPWGVMEFLALAQSLSELLYVDKQMISDPEHDFQCTSKLGCWEYDTLHGGSRLTPARRVSPTVTSFIWELCSSVNQEVCVGFNRLTSIWTNSRGVSAPITLLTRWLIFNYHIT